MPSDLDPRVAAEPEETGAFFVMFRDDCGGPDACDVIENVIGQRPARSGEFSNRLPAFASAFRDSGVGYFDEFGLAIVDPSRMSMNTSRLDMIRARDEVLLVRPEYRYYASGWLSRLLGFESNRRRNNVNQARDVDGAGDANARPGADAGVNPRPDTPVAEPAPGNPRPGEAESDENKAATWGLRAIGADASPLTGAGIKVAVLDTGIDFEHPDLQGRSIKSESFVYGESAQDRLGHGTHVAGIAIGKRAPDGAPRYGVASEAELYVAKVLSDDGSGREGDILAGLLWALENGCEIVNMSLGRRPLPGDSTGDYERIGQRALASGTLIVGAAGNESARSFGIVAPVSSPANAPSIMAVGAVGESLEIADFSNGGLEPDGGAVDIAAPGVGVLSSTPGSPAYRRFSGTSMAAPYVAGVAALAAAADSSLRGRALWDAIVGGAKPINLPARDAGAGLLQSPDAGEPGV